VQRKDKLCNKPDDDNEIAMKMRLSGDINGEAVLHVYLEEAGASCEYWMPVHALSRNWKYILRACTGFSSVALR
jgi:hypothetical protein